MHMRFGILEVNAATRQVVQNNIKSVVKVQLPHTVLFRSMWKKTTGKDNRLCESFFFYGQEFYIEY